MVEGASGVVTGCPLLEPAASEARRVTLQFDLERGQVALLDLAQQFDEGGTRQVAHRVAQLRMHLGSRAVEVVGEHRVHIRICRRRGRDPVRGGDVDRIFDQRSNRLVTLDSVVYRYSYAGPGRPPFGVRDFFRAVLADGDRAWLLTQANLYHYVPA
jgi:hypothetical protein